MCNIFSYVLILIPDWSEQGVQSEVAVHSPTGPTVLLQGKQAIISISLFRSYQIQSHPPADTESNRKNGRGTITIELF